MSCGTGSRAHSAAANLHEPSVENSAPVDEPALFELGRERSGSKQCRHPDKYERQNNGPRQRRELSPTREKLFCNCCNAIRPALAWRSKNYNALVKWPCVQSASRSSFRSMHWSLRSGSSSLRTHPKLAASCTSTMLPNWCCSVGSEAVHRRRPAASVGGRIHRLRALDAPSRFRARRRERVGGMDGSWFRWIPI